MLGGQARLRKALVVLADRAVAAAPHRRCPLRPHAHNLLAVDIGFETKRLMFVQPRSDVERLQPRPGPYLHEGAARATASNARCRRSGAPRDPPARGQPVEYVDDGRGFEGKAGVNTMQWAAIRSALATSRMSFRSDLLERIDGANPPRSSTFAREPSSIAGSHSGIDPHITSHRSVRPPRLTPFRHVAGQAGDAREATRRSAARPTALAGRGRSRPRSGRRAAPEVRLHATEPPRTEC